ncbi:MAG: hypothetical protein Q8O03_07820 [Nanoarchaeota archaeon]|nr:hypothetical protein [Nanoarchaeota archaeon]
MPKLETLLYHCKYTAASYADAFMSVPIWAAEKKSKVAESLCNKLGKETPKFLSWRYIKEKSPVYKYREKLRDSLDTRAGTVYLQSNILGAIPFFFVGMPAAEIAQESIDQWMPGAPEILKYVTNSLATLATQMIGGYTLFMANEIRTNKNKYSDEKGSLKFGKIYEGFKKVVKAFLMFDLSYISLKTAGQSFLLAQGKNPWKASGLFDLLTAPIWYTIAIPLGLHNKIIEPKSERKN